MTEEHAETLRKLKEATREAHEAMKGMRLERRRLEETWKNIRGLAEEAAYEKFKTLLDEMGKDILVFQETVERKLGNRLDLLIEGPIRDLEKLLRELHKVHSTTPISQMTKLPDEPLFKKVERRV